MIQRIARTVFVVKIIPTCSIVSGYASSTSGGGCDGHRRATQRFLQLERVTLRPGIQVLDQFVNRWILEQGLSRKST